MKSYTIFKNFWDNKELRESFNQLAQETFQINFEQWYQYGYWTDAYQPYSLVQNNQIVANASVNYIDVVMNSEPYTAVQIGTVMTHPSHRNKGLARHLLATIISELEEKVDFFYLFANQSVLDFYPKFNFFLMNQYQYTLTNYEIRHKDYSFRKLNLDMKQDRDILFEYAKGRVQESEMFSTIGTQNLTLFYGMYVFANSIYYFEREKVIIIAEQLENQFHIYDIIALHSSNYSSSIFSSLADRSVVEFVFHFTPYRTDDKIPRLEHDKGTVLFVRANKKIIFPKVFKHPITSQA